MNLKQIYVQGVRLGRTGAVRIGLLDALDRRRDRRYARWMRSLFAIYDIDDMIGLDLPWWCFDAVDAVDRFLAGKPDARVFEYGSGASTVWLARRAKTVISVEHDDPWFRIVREKLKPYANATLRLVPPDAVPPSDRQKYGSNKPGWRDITFHDYVHAIDDAEGLFDVIVVDGRSRVACLAQAIPRLSSDGIIVFDNSFRRPYRQAIAGAGLTVKNYRGLAACLPYPDETTLLSHGTVAA